MKKSGYRTSFHIYLIFLLALAGTVLGAAILFLLLITVQKQDGTSVKSDWPVTVTEAFGKQILFVSGSPRVRQAGLDFLSDQSIGLQVLDSSGHELFQYHKPAQAGTAYSDAELAQISRTGRLEDSRTTCFMGTVSHDRDEYTYILHFPMKISFITMYMNGERFAGGKAVILPVTAGLFFVILIAGAVYGLWMAGAIKRLTAALHEIAGRSYLPIHDRSAFQDLYDGLNTLDSQIRSSDRLREQTEKMREEWIANITHDLKTPLSPIKGYAEILRDEPVKEEQCRQYAAVMLKNAFYMETLIDDLKLTYQLENNMIPIRRQEQNIVRFLKELIIDILNTPEYEGRIVHFHSTGDFLLYAFDHTLFTRAFRNLIINSFIHSGHDAEVSLKVSLSPSRLHITVEDNGKGMTGEEAEQLFNRYYRGTDAGKNPEGTGLGLAIVKSIMELHGGSISVSGVPGAGTVFVMDLPVT